MTVGSGSFAVSQAPQKNLSPTESTRKWKKGMKREKPLSLDFDENDDQDALAITITQSLALR